MEHKKPQLSLRLVFCTQGGNRTHTPMEHEFESCAYTNSATWAQVSFQVKGWQNYTKGSSYANRK